MNKYLKIFLWTLFSISIVGGLAYKAVQPNHYKHPLHR